MSGASARYYLPVGPSFVYMSEELMSGANGWEPVYTTNSDILERRRGDHGWLYRNFIRQGSEHGGFEWLLALTYEPDVATDTEPPP